MSHPQPIYSEIAVDRTFLRPMDQDEAQIVLGVRVMVLRAALQPLEAPWRLSVRHPQVKRQSKGGASIANFGFRRQFAEVPTAKLIVATNGYETRARDACGAC